MIKNDLTGKKFGRWTVKSFDKVVKKNTRYAVYWNCVCECGNQKSVEKINLLRGSSQSCGCLQRELFSKKQITHGMSHKPLYEVWRGMLKRCYLSTNPSFKHYGGRNIQVCEVWKNSFENFQEWAIQNGYKQGLTLDRIDFNGNYEPSNCRWVDMFVQQNNKRNNVKFTYNGETHGLSEWARLKGINTDTLWRRIRVYKWDFEKAITTPVVSGGHL